MTRNVYVSLLPFATENKIDLLFKICQPVGLVAVSLWIAERHKNKTIRTVRRASLLRWWCRGMAD